MATSDADARTRSGIGPLPRLGARHATLATAAAILGDLLHAIADYGILGTEIDRAKYDPMREGVRVSRSKRSLDSPMIDCLARGRRTSTGRRLAGV
jgi:hypothetical protein